MLIVPHHIFFFPSYRIAPVFRRYVFPSRVAHIAPVHICTLSMHCSGTVRFCYTITSTNSYSCKLLYCHVDQFVPMLTLFRYSMHFSDAPITSVQIHTRTILVLHDSTVLSYQQTSVMPMHFIYCMQLADISTSFFHAHAISIHHAIGRHSCHKVSITVRTVI